MRFIAIQTASKVKHVASLPSKQELVKGAHLIHFILSHSLTLVSKHGNIIA